LLFWPSYNILVKLRKCGVLGSAFFCVPGMFGSLEVKVLYPS
jgi:hypothetical protein